MRNIPVDLMRSFVAVVEHRGFSRAGNVVGRSQPAMSLQIKRLEALLGGELIRRPGREIELTDTGRLVLDYCRQILGLNDELLYKLAQSKLSGTVRLGIPNEFAMSYLPQILAGFTKRYPDVRLEVVSQLSKDLLKEQQEEHLDLVIAFGTDNKAPEAAVWDEDIVWVQSDTTNLDWHGKLPLVVAPQGCFYREHMLETLDNHKTPWQIVYTGTSYGGIRAAVVAGLGVTALARSTVPPELTIVRHSKVLPKLKNAKVSIHFLRDNPDDSVNRLAEFIMKSTQNSNH